MKIKKCFQCGAYTLKSVCPNCQSQTYYPKPPKFSLTDKYGKYRRKQKLMDGKHEHDNHRT